MQTGGDLLWRVNNEYRKRLAQAQTFLDLLEQMVLAGSGGQHQHTLHAIHYVREQIEVLVEEHRDWRRDYYYESPETKRMVQQNRSVNRALSRFSRMHTQHESRLHDLYLILNEVVRPHPDVTRVPSGDLWEMSQFALYDLIEFNDYLAQYTQAG
ncbi:MAG: hypothetical protein KC496_07960 [Anaerolineae bacterium]|nr:hypothetical protein [Anaerolineae bacterium]